MKVDPKSLVQKLNRTCTGALEAAVSSAARGAYFEIAPEHLLLSLFELAQGDIPMICQALGLDQNQVCTELTRRLTRMRQGNEARPVFCASLFEWIEQAWLVSSVQHEATLVRSGDLLLEFLAGHDRYCEARLDSLRAVDLDQFRSLYPSQIDAELADDGHKAVQDAKDRRDEKRPDLERYCISLTELAAKGALDPIFGREDQIRLMIDVLSRRRKNNPIIVGEPGVGKSALVEGLALSIAANEVPESLRGNEIWRLDLGLLSAGTGVRGELEDRLKRILAQVDSSPVPIILFIDEAHTILGGAGQDKGELANLLKPKLARGELRTIAATTFAEYKKYFEKDAALERRFQPVQVPEPSIPDAITMLRGLAKVYEHAHGVVIRDEAVKAAVELSSRYIPGRLLPDKAVDLLDTAATRVRMEGGAPPLALTKANKQLLAKERELSVMQRDLRDGLDVDPERIERTEQDLKSTRKEASELEQRWKSEQKAVAKLNQRLGEVANASPDALADAKAALGAARSELEALQGQQGLISAEVDKACIARIVADWTKIPVGKLVNSAVDRILSLPEQLATAICGQDDAIAVVSERMRMAHADLRNPDTPRAVLLFAGPSGVGKTQTVHTLADKLYGDPSAVITINMSEYQEKHSVSRLVGSPPGYVGYGEGGVLTQAVRQRPYSVVLLDECEKADLEVMNLFYQVFDKGTLADGEGRIIDFRNTVVVLTSNLGSELIHRMHQEGPAPSHSELIEAISPTLARHFKPALLGRMTVVPYRPLGEQSLAQIAALKLDKVSARVHKAHDLALSFEPSVHAAIAKRCQQSPSGARMVEQVLSHSLLPELSRELLLRATSEQPYRKLAVSYENDKWSFQAQDLGAQ